MFILVKSSIHTKTPPDNHSNGRYIQTTISDLVQISPHDFEKPSAAAIEDNINAKYANKVRAQSLALREQALMIFP